MAEVDKNRTASKRRMSKQDWMQASLDTLQKAGIDAVRVERIAAKLGIAKSGFYYHFADRNDLCEAMLDYWLTLDGTPFFSERLRPDATCEERLAVVSEVVDQANLSRYDTAIRQWAKHDPKVARVWRKEMKKRIAHIRGLFETLGFTGDDLEVRTRLFVAYTTSERDLFPDLSADARRKYRDIRLRILLTP